MATRAYSHLFSCLHDEAEPVGNLGRGTHHSICRAVTWLGVDLTPLPAPLVHDFAILWDEDHDERVIPVVEGLLMAGLLAPVLFIGERKGSLTLVVDSALFDGTCVAADAYAEQVQNVCEANCGVDHWPSEVFPVDRPLAGLKDLELRILINDEAVRVLSYLRGIDALWNLGIKPYSPSSRSISV